MKNEIADLFCLKWNTNIGSEALVFPNLLGLLNSWIAQFYM